MQHPERTTRRHPVDLEAIVTLAGPSPRTQVCRLRDMSIGGSFLELGPLPLGTRLNVNFSLPILQERLSLDAVVHWSTDAGVGVQFEGLRPWEVWVLWRFLESLARARRGSAAETEIPAAAVAPPPHAAEVSPPPADPPRPEGDVGAAPWSRRRHVVRTLLSRKAQVENGRLKLDEPIDLPHGALVAVVVFEDGGSDDRRAKLLQIIEDGDTEATGAEVVGFSKVIAEL